MSVYQKQRRDYDIQLANFIKKHYETLSEKRWKYILEYNKMKKTVDKEKKEKELRRLLRLVNAESRIEDDVLPEKHLILDEAIQRSDGPAIPTSNIIFTMADFRRHFKPYY